MTAANPGGTSHIVKARWPLSLPPDRTPGDIDLLRKAVEQTALQAQYGWGHTIDFGPFRKDGLLGDKYLELVGLLDAWGWLPRDLSGAQIADIGCFTGGIAMLLAGRGAARVWAIDEVPEHLAQAQVVQDAFGVRNVTTVQTSLYDLERTIAPESLDVVVLSGVLYHLSDMLAGLIVVQRLLKPGGTVLIETNAVEDFTHSYANFGRYFEGMWWQPTALAVLDMITHAGLGSGEVRFYKPGRALARATKPQDSSVPFKRGVNIDFPDRRDDVTRTRDAGLLAPAPSMASDTALVRRVLLRAWQRVFSTAIATGYGVVRRVRARQRGTSAE